MTMAPQTRFLIAFDKYKGAISAAEACAAAAEAIRGRLPGARMETAPLTDGGEGFAAILGAALGGELRTAAVPGPRFQPVEGRFALAPAANIPPAAWRRLHFPESLRECAVGIVEMASASGYESLSAGERDPWRASTLGTGLLLQAAVDAGARAIILGIGGSATNDCGAGALEALGVRYYDRELQPVSRVVPENFARINTLGSTSHLLGAFPPLRIACDVTNPLLGPQGATRVFGPQKGLKEADFERMERVTRKMGMRILGLFGRDPATWEEWLAEPGAGAAGGIGFALRHALPDAAFVEGFPLVAELLDLPARAGAADCLLTGEGRLDASSLSGKGPVGLLRMADAGQPVWLFAGSMDADTAEQLRKDHPRLEVIPISDPDWPLEAALARTAASLQNAIVERIAGERA
jgi:glycerate 2-kinase